MMNINLTKNELTKRILGLVIIVGFAFMGIIACPSGGGGDDTPATNGDGNSNGNGNGNGNGAMMCTATDTSLTQVSDLAVTSMATSSSAGSVTLTWMDPTDDGFTGVEISGGTPALASPIIVAKGTQTATIPATVGEVSNFEVRTMYGTNCSAVATRSATPSFDGGNNGAMMCEATDDSLVQVGNLAATSMATSSSNGSVTLTWTDPTESGFTGVEITGGTPALASPSVIAKGIETASFTALTVGTESTFTVKTMYGTNCSTGATASATPSFDGNVTMMCTATDASLTEVTNIAVTPATTVTDVNDAFSLTITWTDSTASGFTGVEISGGTPALASPIVVAAGTQTASVMGLTMGTASTFVVKSMYGANCSTGETRSGTTPALPEVTSPTATPIVATGPNDAGGITLTWTQPTVSGFTGVEITGGAPALANPMMVAAGTQTATITGLTVGTASTFTVKSVYGSNSSTGVATTAATPQGAIALFSLGKQTGTLGGNTGDGFAVCQNALDAAANTNLSSRGYTQARFFGSTPVSTPADPTSPSDGGYDFKNIATDIDALGVTGATIGDYTIATFTDLTGTTAPTTAFGSPTATTRSLSNILNLSGGTAFNWSTANRAVIETVTGGPLSATNAVWVFSTPAGIYFVDGVNITYNCMGATNDSSGMEIRGATASNGGHTFIGTTCDSDLHVLCVAR